MNEQNKDAKAKVVFKSICNELEKRDWKYVSEEEELSVGFEVTGDDIPMDVIFIVDIERQLIKLWSPLPFKFSENKRTAGAVATCAATFVLADGSFDYDITDGSVTYRMTASFIDSYIGEKLISYMIEASCAAVDRYNDMFLALEKGIIDISEFIGKV